jgi:hypothetical protein
MKYLLLILLLFSCGKPQQLRGLPQNRASQSEQEILNNVLTNIQKYFDDLNIKINLKSIRYSVNSLGGTKVGICYRKKNGQGIGIAIDHTVFLSEIESENYYGRIYNILLHEIGHCFFNRNHEEKFLNLDGQQMIVRLDPLSNAQHAYNQFVTSIMVPYEAFVIMPKILWPYYIKEIAGIDRIENIEDVKQYAELSLSTPYSVNFLQQNEHHN